MTKATQSLATHFPLRVTEWLLAGMLTTWGIICFQVDAVTWASPVFSGLRSIFPQTVWATMALVIGLARMVSLFINGAFHRTPHARAIGAFLAVFIWLQLSFGMFGAEVVTTGMAVYPWLCMVEVYNVYRASQDAQLSDRRVRASRGARADAQRT